jgi:hypothetical protein
MRPQNMTEWELLEHAAKALLAAFCMPAGSVERCLLWAAHDLYMAELRHRAYRALAMAEQQ